MNRKKILYIITKAEIGGAQNHIDLLISNLPESYLFVLCCGSGGPLIENLVGVDVYIIPELNRKSFFPALFALLKLIRSQQPDLIHTHSAIASFIGRIAGRVARVKTLYTVHGWHFVPNSVLQRRVFGWLLELIARPFTDAWITVSQYDKELGVSSRLIDPARTWVIPNGVEDIHQVHAAKQDDRFDLAFVGRASYQKNCLEAVEVLELSDERAYLTMYVTSGDHLDALQQCIHASSARERIKLITDDSDAAASLYRYDAMLLTSRYEGMPLCVLEAMRAGLVVIATDVCGLNELVKQGETGFLYPLYDIDQAANYINTLLDSSLSAKFGDSARQHFEQNFLAQQMAEKTNETYKRLLAN